MHTCRLLRRAPLGVHRLHRCVWTPAKQKETQSSCPAHMGRPPAIRCCPRTRPARPSFLAKRNACLTASRRLLPLHSLPVRWPRERMKLEVGAPWGGQTASVSLKESYPGPCLKIWTTATVAQQVPVNCKALFVGAQASCIAGRELILSAHFI